MRVRVIVHSVLLSLPLASLPCPATRHRRPLLSVLKSHSCHPLLKSISSPFILVLASFSPCFPLGRAQVYYRFEDAVVVGVRLAQTRQILLIPPDDLVLSHGDQVLLLSNSLPTLEALSTLEIRAVRQLRLSQASDLSVVSPSGSVRAGAHEHHRP